MALFKKKSDPISERSKALNDQIAALESEIQRLSKECPPPNSTDVEEREPPVAVEPVHVAPASVGPQPRLRSTAFPHKHHPPSQQLPANPFAEPPFEDVSPNAAKLPLEPVAPAHQNELGVRKYDLISMWRRLTNHFRGPATSNPKLVNYLAAGSIQGLRPLRYEKRVARNRFIVLVLVLIAVLWGLIAVLMKRS
jgi:hypothetical protein